MVSSSEKTPKEKQFFLVIFFHALNEAQDGREAAVSEAMKAVKYSATLPPMESGFIYETVQYIIYICRIYS